MSLSHSKITSFTKEEINDIVYDYVDYIKKDMENLSHNGISRGYYNINKGYSRKECLDITQRIISLLTTIGYKTYYDYKGDIIESEESYNFTYSLGVINPIID